MATAISTATRPDASEHVPYYGKYIALVPEDHAIQALESQIADALALLRTIPESKGDHRYGPDKWTIKEVIGHMADTERVMQYRALGIARGDQTSFPPFEQDDYAKTSGHGERTWSSLLDEFKAVRQSSIHLFRHLDEASLDRVGSVNQNPTTARAVGYVIVGHERHHLAILKEKYVAAPA